MEFEKGLIPRGIGPRGAALVLGLVGALVCLAFGAMNGWPQAVLATLKPPTPTNAPSLFLPAAATPTTAESLLTQPLPATSTPLPAPSQSTGGSETRPDSPPIPVPTATWFYIVPAQPSPIPTPVLPAAAPFPSSCDGPGRLNILLIGVDGWNDSYNRAARSDTIMLLGVNASAKTAQMLSIPRDLWVQLPGLAEVPEARINTAYHYGEYYGVPGGGPAELSATIANTFGLRVDRYIVVNFSAFEQGVDAIGGVDINIPAPIHDDKYPLRDGSGTIAIDFPAGAVHMDGATALIYARTRHDSSDFNRMLRQQQVMFAARDKLLSPETIPQLPALAQVLINAARTDISFDDLGLLGCLGPQIDSSNIQTWVIDSRMTTSTVLADGAQVLLPNMDAILPVLQAFNTGE